MVVNSEALIGISKGIKQLWYQSSNETVKDYEKIATVVEAIGSESIDYHWLGDIPQMREWIGERQFKNLIAYKYTIKKKDWEASISVTRDDIYFDKLGVIKPKVNSLNYAVNNHHNDMVFGLIEKNGVCYDGCKMFSTHTVGEKTYTNISTKALTATNLWNAITFMTMIKTDTGNSLKVKPNILYVAPNLVQIAKKLLMAETIEGTTNTLRGIVDLEVSTELSSNAWCLMDTNKPIKPFILQITKKAELVAMDKLDDEAVFTRKEFRYGVDCMDNAGYGLWQLAYYSDGSDETTTTTSTTSETSDETTTDNTGTLE